MSAIENNKEICDLIKPSPANVKGSLEDRMKKVEEQLEKQKSKHKDFWERLQALSSLISGLAVVVVGYLLTGSVNQAIQERQLELSNLKEMRELMIKLGTSDIDIENAEATAVTLAVFGKYAVIPLIHQLQNGGVNRSLAAEKGLRALALTNRSDVGKAVCEILNNRTRLFTWQTHRQAIRLAGVIGCKEVEPILKVYEVLIRKTKTEGVIESYKKIVQEDSSLNMESIALLQNELERTRELLSQK
jgi:hypothetical protein